MLKSMTGYGEAMAEGKTFAFSVELKSVNNRFLKIVAKIADEVSYLQNDLEELVRKRVVRGSVSFTVRFAPTRYVDLYEIDEEVLKKYMATLNRIKDDLNSKEEIFIKDLLLLPGVIHTEETLILGKQEVLPVALKAMEDALDHLLAMRGEEGAHLEEEFRKRTEGIFGLVSRVKVEAPQALQEYRQKLEERLNLLLTETGITLSQEDLLKELAILAERSDITEEVARLESHLKQFMRNLDSAQPVGRKLEFIVQEMAREANTMGAKSNNTTLNQSIMEIKAEVDRLKEQVMNVE